MKRITKLLSAFLIITNLFASAQNNNNDILKNGTIDKQFEYVLKKSSNYRNYKVVKTSLLNTLKSHVNDSIKKAKNTLIEFERLIEKHKNEYQSAQQELVSLKEELKEVTESKDVIKLLGIPLNRSLYKTVMWSIIAFLVFALLYFIYLFKNSNQITKKCLSDYKELESEYNVYRTRSLEREQVINRKLQDEINKHKKC